MIIAPLSAITENQTFIDTAEIKQWSLYHDVDESLSEWELARQMSKTWSMEQE